MHAKHYLVALRAFSGRSPARGAAQTMTSPSRRLLPSALCTMDVIQSGHRSVTPIYREGVGERALHTSPRPPVRTVLCLALPVMLFCLQLYIVHIKCIATNKRSLAKQDQESEAGMTDNVVVSCKIHSAGVRTKAYTVNEQSV